MDKQKQIEEMAKDLVTAFTKPLEKCLYPESTDCKGKSCERFNPNAPCRFMNIAENLYNAGVRKTFTSSLASDTQAAYKEGYNKACCDFDNGFNAGKSVGIYETAKEIFDEWENNLDSYIDFGDFIDRMKERFGVEVDE